MYSKLSLNNVKRSLRDYIIYFLTLSFGVCLFYIFNALESQQVMFELTSSQLSIMKSLSTAMSVMSLFISVILCFLILYANNFLIKRRKKELGIYLTLGMEKKTVSYILLIEAFIIDTIALIAGILAGVFLSQGLSILTAKLFEVNLTAFTFIFSSEAALKTVLYFSIIFIFVMCFNTYTISKYELIDLLQADRKNETLKSFKTRTSLLLFLGAVALLGTAYYLAIKNGLISFNRAFLLAIVLGVIGTYLFYMSVSDLAVKFITYQKGLYYKNLNMFIFKQVSSKMNTHRTSMSLICLMLFLTLTILSTALSFSNVLVKKLEISTPFDASFYTFDEEDTQPLSILLKSQGFPLDSIASSYLDFNSYATTIHYSDFFSPDTMQLYSKSLHAFTTDSTIPALKLSDFNKLLQMQGFPPLTLPSNQYAVSSNYLDIFGDIKGRLAQDINVTQKDTELSPVALPPYFISYETTYFPSSIITLVMPDELLENAPIYDTYLNINYKGDKESTEAIFQNQMRQLGDNDFFRPYSTKIEVYTSAVSLSTIATYIGIYLGFVFLIASSAILALQQLFEVADHTKRYELLRKIGVSQSELHRSLFIQIAIYFFAPLSLALVHSSVGLYIANEVVQKFGQSNITINTFYTCLFILLVYSIYFLATYFGSKHVITPKK